MFQAVLENILKIKFSLDLRWTGTQGAYNEPGLGIMLVRSFHGIWCYERQARRIRAIDLKGRSFDKDVDFTAIDFIDRDR